jgi:outer membrane protein OmpA-like peptidoglycan-associated protein
MCRSPTSRLHYQIAAAAIIVFAAGFASGAPQPDPVAVGWQDPEPPGAQAVAESVVDKPYNEDKITHLRMHITMLVDRTTGIAGFASAVEPARVPLEDRLEALGASVTDTEITIRLPGSILFDFDSDAIRPDARRSLVEILEVIGAYGERPVRVEGHTDSVASEAYNQELSERRARSVADWLTAQGVAAGRLEVKGWGESRPVADNADPEGRQQNRRVELIIEK